MDVYEIESTCKNPTNVPFFQETFYCIVLGNSVACAFRFRMASEIRGKYFDASLAHSNSKQFPCVAVASRVCQI